MDLAKKHVPYFIFANDESYYPCSFEYLLRNSDLRIKDTIVKVGPSMEDLMNNNTPETYLDIKSLEGELPENINVPVYYHILPLANNETLIQYYLMYAFNAPKFVTNLNKCLGDTIAERYEKTPGCLKCMYKGDHKYDLEHVDVLLDEKGNKKSVYYGAHRECDGLWVNNTDDVDGHPLAYVSSGGHGHYPTNKTAYRIFCCANDYVSSGYVFQPKTLIDLETEKWNTDYVGGLEYVNTGDTPKKHTYYNNKIDKSTNWFKRLFCPCVE